MRHLPTFFLIAAAGATLAAMSLPQDPPAVPRPGAPAAGSKQDDGFLAAWLLIGNGNAIGLAQIAQQRATDSEVKQFAQKMIDEHRQLGQKLEPFASAVGVTSSSTTPQPPGEARAKERPAGEAGAAGRTDAAGRTGTTGGLDHVALIQDLGRQCMDTARRELEQKQGADFDRCFMHAAVGGHMQANDMMTVFQRHASSDLRTEIANCQKAISSHLEHAKTLAKKLDDKSAGGGSK